MKTSTKKQRVEGHDPAAATGWSPWVVAQATGPFSRGPRQAIGGSGYRRIDDRPVDRGQERA